MFRMAWNLKNIRWRSVMKCPVSVGTLSMPSIEVPGPPWMWSQGLSDESDFVSKKLFVFTDNIWPTQNIRICKMYGRLGQCWKMRPKQQELLPRWFEWNQQKTNKSLLVKPCQEDTHPWISQTGWASPCFAHHRLHSKHWWPYRGIAIEGPAYKSLVPPSTDINRHQLDLTTS